MKKMPKHKRIRFILIIFRTNGSEANKILKRILVITINSLSKNTPNTNQTYH